MVTVHQANFISPQLGRALARVLSVVGNPPLYLAGGALRAWLSGLPVKDLDFTLPAGAVDFARRLAEELSGELVGDPAAGLADDSRGVMVPLDREHDVARVVWQRRELDFSSFREGAETIEEDLSLRDFTINAMAVLLNPLELTQGGGAAGRGVGWEAEPPEGLAEKLLDPTGGYADLRGRVIRVTSQLSFQADPLRLLRAHRFQATLGFSLSRESAELIKREHRAVGGVAAERIRAELDLIIAASGAASALSAMADNGLLFEVLPEFAAGVGMAQPDSHHLDVASHGLETLACMERILLDPSPLFPDSYRSLNDYLADPLHPRRTVTLRWAALLHDLGKPAAAARQGGRITFHNHDRAGAEMVSALGRRLRFSRERLGLLWKLVANHMWPFHLLNARRGGKLSLRARLRLLRAMGDDLSPLFLLAMADTLAGRGPGKPPGLEEELAEFHRELIAVERERIAPLRRLPPLLTGHDLQGECGLSPGPLFKKILSGLEEARMEGEVNTREQALDWVKHFVTIQQHPILRRSG